MREIYQLAEDQLNFSFTTLASRSLLLILKFTEIHQLTTGSMGKEKQKINEDIAYTMKNLACHETQ
jgi:hypothetical protein